MRFFLTLALFLGFAGPAVADPARLVETAIAEHVLPGFAELTEQSKALASASEASCKPDDATLRAAYNAAFDAWLAVGHLRFGPTEIDSRGFALTFWPDPRSKTSKALANLIRTEDVAVEDPEVFATLSVAARGFFALERMLYDPAIQAAGEESYRCQLTRAIAADIARTSALIERDWVEGYAPLMLSAGTGNETYATPREAVKEFFKSLSSGLQFTSELRLGRPLGTFDRPRPRRAEARLSERSLRNVVLSVETSRELASILAAEFPEIDAELATAELRVKEQASELDDPVFASVSDVTGRLRVEILQQSVDSLRNIIRNQLGPALGVAQGFNALDGD
ncbi:MAG: imelysin family protein [Pseudomonadota bacterium]